MDRQVKVMAIQVTEFLRETVVENMTIRTNHFIESLLALK